MGGPVPVKRNGPLFRPDRGVGQAFQPDAAPVRLESLTYAGPLFRPNLPGTLMATARVLVLRAPGANCDAETQFAFEEAGAVADRTHINRLRASPALLQRHPI